ncbi:MAG: hypothetical protein NTU73_10360 [Ignavibacteriae bacterium]|nr:hypothetical protein [Ignavibacteriota bacterium]
MLKKINILVLFFLLISGCGLFGLRDAETPTEPRSRFDPPITPDVVLGNLSNAVTDKDVNNYLQCIVDTSLTTKKFVYTADISSQIQYPVFQNWQITNEKNYFFNLVSLTGLQNTSLLFYSDIISNTYSDSAVYDMEYFVRFDHPKTTVAKNLKGKLRFVMVINSRNLWAISRWTDFKSLDTDTTWSVLKANFSN